jgi:Putative bacterial sensory transduction regulator
MPTSSTKRALSVPELMSEFFTEPDLFLIEEQIDGWLKQFRAENPTILAIDRDEGDVIRWYVRLQGEEKEFTTVWLTLGQRTLKYETYVLPWPPENRDQVYETVLRANDTLTGVHFSIGDEDAIYLRGELVLTALNANELDRIIGTCLYTVERYFPALIRLAFASRFES